MGTPTKEQFRFPFFQSATNADPTASTPTNTRTFIHYRRTSARSGRGTGNADIEWRGHAHRPSDANACRRNSGGTARSTAIGAHQRRSTSGFGPHSRSFPTFRPAIGRYRKSANAAKRHPADGKDWRGTSS